jgi:hypothetical protein
MQIFQISAYTVRNQLDKQDIKFTSKPSFNKSGRNNLLGPSNYPEEVGFKKRKQME